MADSLLLVKFAGLTRSGVVIEKAIQIIGGLPEDKNLRYLLRVSTETGSAIAREIDQVATIYLQRERAFQRIAVAQTGPRSSARLVLWLPVLTLLLAQVSGIGVMAAVSRNVLLVLSFGLGAMLLVVAKLVSSKLVRKATPEQDQLGFYLLVVALACSGGISLHKAQNKALEMYKEVFGEIPTTHELQLCAEALHISTHTGARVGELLRGSAEALQREAATKAEIKIEKLSVRLLLPLGFAVLPAFILIAVIPLTFSILGSK
jgi:tight adherence protein B